MPAVRVSLGERSYPIFIGRGLLAQIGRLVRRQGVSQSRALVVSQKNIAERYFSTLEAGLSREAVTASLFLTPPAKSSEAAKSQNVFFGLVRALSALDGNHQTPFLIALGGGVIGDLTGFAASVYRRGIPYVQVPTTLTAQVDSAIGGKTGIDLPAGKNLLGTIYQPAFVASDTDLLASLPDRQWGDGFAEVIKYGVIRDSALFALLEKNGKEGIRANPRLLEKVIYRSARIKARVVQNDERDKKGVRLILNFGHTAGHAIEAASGYSLKYTHGEAVAIGMLVACGIAQKMGVLKDQSLRDRLEKTLLKFDLPVFYRGLPLGAIMKALGYDKKSEGGVNRFVLPIALGKVAAFRDVPAEWIAEALQARKR